ncbi:glutathione-disulfide reductase [Amaricoccus solimangrovi]|uniref:Glutathione reductase n=1 Tax=Amaricoccus solimangrovi TaxID=2589815 RepID=A0A501X1A9_9RHOB|nr:glutathione-disulfide reductase [Amaricoccus solimangrovi]TPE53546.1 glutathione-disulfide reductase [Amaricoccus solimangrovi]
MSGFDFDLFVIGAGSAGVRAARVAAEHGARVAVAEEYRYGGTCVIRGCVPKKLMVYASGFSEMIEDAAAYGWNLGPASFDWPRFLAAKDHEIARLEGIYKSVLERAGAEVFHQRASLVDPHRVRIADGREFSTGHVLIATGGAPFVPDIPGAELGVTSNEMFELSDLPRRAIVVGGGYIACEFAGILNGLGVEVTQLYRRERILRGFDEDVRVHVEEAMRARGVDIWIGADVTALRRAEGGEIVATLDQGGEIETDLVLFATGRRPNTGGLGLAELGVRFRDDGAIAVDEWSQTAVPSIYAAGDVTGRAELTPVAIREGQAFAETVFGGTPVRPEHVLIPTAVFTQPEIGTVGLTEAEARGKGEVEIYRAAFRPMLNILAGRDEKMLMKLVVGAGRRVLGCHIVGHGAGEMIQLAAVAIRMGATKEDFDRTIAVHPTAAEELVTMRTPVA